MTEPAVVTSQMQSNFAPVAALPNAATPDTKNSGSESKAENKTVPSPRDLSASTSQTNTEIKTQPSGKGVKEPFDALIKHVKETLSPTKLLVTLGTPYLL